MKTMKRYFFLIPLIIFLFFKSSYCQNFDKIVPLQSTCDDVKQVLNVDKCDFPQSIYRLKEFTIVIDFAEEKFSEKKKIFCNVPPKTVFSFSVTYNKYILLKDFEHKLTLVRDLNNDIGTIAYENKEKGITVFGDSEYIGEVIYLPIPENFRKYSCSDVKKK